MKKSLLSLTLLVAMLLNVFAPAGCTGGGDNTDNDDDKKSPFGNSDGIELPIVDWEPDEE